MSKRENKRSDHVYLIISPNPAWENYTAAKAYEVKDGEKTKLEKREKLHFLKVGDEKNFGTRISEYNTHNPQIWFHYIHFSDYAKNKQAGLGTNIEKELFEGFQRSKSSNEWLLIWNAGAELKALCERVLEYPLEKKPCAKGESNQAFDFVDMGRRENLIKELKDAGVTKGACAQPGSGVTSEVKKKKLKTETGPKTTKETVQEDEERKINDTSSDEDPE